MSEFTKTLAHWLRQPGGRWVMATVVRATGSTYRRPGARMLISEAGECFGVVSGGCLEKDVARQAAQVMRTGTPLLVSYDTRAMLGCNGVVEIFLEALPEGDSFLSTAADQLLERREAFVGATIFEARGGAASPLGTYPLLPRNDFSAGLPALPEAFQRECAEALSANRALLQTHPTPEGEATVLLHALRPPVRLLITGSGSDTAPLASFALRLGWQVTGVSHPAQDAPELPPGCKSCVAAAEELPALVSDDPWTVAVVMTHNYGRDLSYLAALLPLSLPYLGLLGPRNRREKLLADLSDTGLTLTPEHLESFFRSRRA